MVPAIVDVHACNLKHLIGQLNKTVISVRLAVYAHRLLRCSNDGWAQCSIVVELYVRSATKSGDLRPGFTGDRETRSIEIQGGF